MKAVGSSKKSECRCDVSCNSENPLFLRDLSLPPTSVGKVQFLSDTRDITAIPITKPVRSSDKLETCFSILRCVSREDNIDLSILVFSILTPRGFAGKYRRYGAAVGNVSPYMLKQIYFILLRFIMGIQRLIDCRVQLHISTQRPTWPSVFSGFFQ